MENQPLGLVHESSKNLWIAETEHQGNYKGLSADFNSPVAIQTTFDEASLVSQNANIHNFFSSQTNPLCSS